MKRLPFFTARLDRLALLSLSLTLVACGEKPAAPAPSNPAPAQPAGQTAPATPAPAEAPAKPAQPDKASSKAPAEPAHPPGSADALFASPPSVDLNGFGSDEPVERADLPDRGVIRFTPKDFIHTTMEHWEQYDWTTFKPARWGRYNVRLTYTLTRPTLAVQFRLGETRLKKNLPGSKDVRQAYLGTVYIEKADLLPFAMFAPSAGAGPALDIREVALIPARESDDEITASTDGTLTLHAKNAITWSQAMRYEPKPEKNCLGFWTDPADFAEWEFVVTKPGRYQVTVSQGCGPGNGGSQVELRLNGQKAGFTVVETTGFQDWKDLAAGTLEIQQPGLQRLVVQPLDKKGKAVMDIQKIVLKPL